METVTRGPVSAAALVWRRGAGWVLTVVCKATLDVVPGEARVRAEAAPLLDRDVPWEGPYGRSLRASADLVPMKPKVDVLLTGHAYAPFRVPVKLLVARLAVGGLDKSIEIWADRFFDQARVLQVGQPFAQMPLVYERAAGGARTWNLAGVSVGVRDANGNFPLPNLQPPRLQLGPPDKLFIAPVGFGPIPGDWPSRSQSLGGRSPRDVPTQWNEQVLPDDIGSEYFNAAPLDQQLPSLSDDETLTLENLHREHQSLQCKLPALRPAVQAEVAGSKVPVSMHLDTLHVDTDRGTCSLVWRGHVPLNGPRDAARVHVVLDAPKPPVRPPTLPGTASTPSQGTAPGAAAGLGVKVGVPSPDAAVDGTMTLAPMPSAGVAPRATPFAANSPAPAPGAHPLSQSSSSWEAVRAASPVASASPMWNAEMTLLPMPASPRASEPEPASPGRSSPATDPLPPPVTAAASPPAPQVLASLPAVMAPVVVAVPAVVVSSGVADSRWSAGDGAKRETIGMQVASGAMALSEPKYEPLPPAVEGVSGASATVQLIWFDPESVARIRRAPRWKAQLDEVHDEPRERDPDESPGREPWEIEDRREVFEVLARGAESDARGVEEAYSEGRRTDGKRVPLLVLVAGDLEIQLDELACLKAAASAASPLVTAADEGLRAAVAAADAFMNRPGLMTTPAVCEGLLGRIREAFVREKKGLPADYLDRQVEQAALTGRCYQKRRLLGGTYLRAFVWMPGEKEGTLAYVPEALESMLPMYRRIAVRVIAEVHPQLDQYEARPLALRVLAVGRRG